MKRARSCSAQRVTSWPASRIVPASRRKVPATELSSVDFPEPFVPMTITNEPASRLRSMPRKARTSLAVPAWNVFAMRVSSSISACSAIADALQSIWQDERGEHEDRGDQLEIVRIQPGAQRDGDEQAEQNRPH